MFWSVEKLCLFYGCFWLFSTFDLLFPCFLIVMAVNVTCYHVFLIILNFFVQCLQVRWDDVEANRHNRVSPWEIELSGLLSGSSSLTVPGSKRTRIGLPGTRPDFSVPSRSMSSKAFFS